MSFLDDLLTSTKARVAETKGLLTEDVLEQRIASARPPRGFAAALGGDGIAIIAEIKRATPSKGPLGLDLDAAATAKLFADAGAAALSVLTEPEFFKGSMEDLELAGGAGIPVLRKDFVVDPFQILEARAAGADSVLLIVRIVGPELTHRMAQIRSLGMDALVEVYDENDLERALDAGADLIGVNHRDLETFAVDPQRTLKLASLVPDGVSLVALSGVSKRAEVEELEHAGASAVLVGEALVRASDPAAKLKELLGR
jgi:indole-3-glycerol phosphate synthase